MTRSLLREVVITGAARTPVGRFGGGLAPVPAPGLGVMAARAAIDQSGIEPSEIEYTVMGNMLSAGLGQTPARQVSIGAGVPENVSALTVNKACASGLISVILAAQIVQLSEAETVLAGGMENMSATPHMMMNSRTGQRLGDANLIDHMIHDGLWCPFENRHMGDSAEAIADKYEVSRIKQDEFAVRSHSRAIDAIDKGLFDAELIGIEHPQTRGKPISINQDEGPRRGSSIMGMESLTPAFPPGDSVTAGNASQISDGAAALVVMSEDRAWKTGVEPLVRIVGYAHSANKPGMLFDAPVTAVEHLLERTGEKLERFDLIEINEAFAAQVLANGTVLGWDWDKVNISGGAIALGHPIGASGARILVTLVHGLRRTGNKNGLAVICHAGGGAVAMSVEVI